MCCSEAGVSKRRKSAALQRLPGVSMNSANQPGTGFRFLPEEPLPHYTYVPGKQPHPESDPAGHSYGRLRDKADPIDPANWRASRPYLRGLDLFNCGLYWESHVEFERLWLAAKRKGPVADVLKAIIHLAAAGVKSLEGRPEGVLSHARRAAELLGHVERGMDNGNGEMLGLSVRQLIHLATQIIETGWPDSPPMLLPYEASS